MDVFKETTPNKVEQVCLVARIVQNICPIYQCIPVPPPDGFWMFLEFLDVFGGFSIGNG